MRDAPAAVQWIIWLAILALVATAAGVIDYYAYGTLTAYKGVPQNMASLVSEPDKLLTEIVSFPAFLMVFAGIWFFFVLIIFLIASRDTNKTFLFAAGTWLVLFIFVLLATKINNAVDDAYDEARILNILNGPDRREIAGEEHFEGGVGNNTKDDNAGLAWELTDHLGSKPSGGELSAVTIWMHEHSKASAIKLEKIYRAYYVSPEIIRLLVEHKRTPPSVWTALCESACNRLGVFFYHKNDDLISLIARDSRTNAQFLLRLLQLPEPNLEKDVFSNPKATPQLKELYTSAILPLRQASPAEKLAAAQKPDIAPYLLTGLSWESDSAIRIAVAHNPATPPYTIQRLAYDPVPEVSDAARTVMQSPQPPPQPQTAPQTGTETQPPSQPAAEPQAQTQDQPAPAPATESPAPIQN